MARETAARQNKGRASESYPNDFERITGEPYSLRAIILRTHPDDIVAAIRHLVRACAAGRFDHIYRLRAANGEYCRAHGYATMIEGRWVGHIDVLGRTDCPIPSSLCAFLLRNVRNGAIPFLAFDLVELILR